MKSITVSELIEILSYYSPRLPVVIEGEGTDYLNVGGAELVEAADGSNTVICLQVDLVYPAPVDVTPEELAQAMFNTKPKRDDEWKYLGGSDE